MLDTLVLPHLVQRHPPILILSSIQTIIQTIEPMPIVNSPKNIVMNRCSTWLVVGRSSLPLSPQTLHFPCKYSILLSPAYVLYPSDVFIPDDVNILFSSALHSVHISIFELSLIGLMIVISPDLHFVHSYRYVICNLFFVIHIIPQLHPI